MVIKLDPKKGYVDKGLDKYLFREKTNCIRRNSRGLFIV